MYRSVPRAHRGERCEGRERSNEPMKSRRIHIMGASGAGVTTLGRALADAAAFPHHDADDYFWLPTTPPYRKMRERDDRLRLIREIFLERSDWVLSGSIVGWGDSIAKWFDLVLYVQVPTEIRLKRLRDREARHFGTEAVSPGGVAISGDGRIHRMGLTLR
jgi:adenylate kinase family enzyme